jgi:hypothetical protein
MKKRKVRKLTKTEKLLRELKDLGSATIEIANELSEETLSEDEEKKIMEAIAAVQFGLFIPFFSMAVSERSKKIMMGTIAYLIQFVNEKNIHNYLIVINKALIEMEESDELPN